MTRAPASCLGRARAIAAVLVALAAALPAAALAPGCDRVVNLTPFYDAQPAPDAHPSDGSFGLDAGRDDATAAPGDGSALPDDGSALPDDGSALPDDGSALPDDAQ
jgi:hypothetical protein